MPRLEREKTGVMIEKAKNMAKAKKGSTERRNPENSNLL